MSVLDVLGGQIREGVLAPPQRIGEPTPTRNVLGINHPLAESHLLPRSVVAMTPFGGATSGFTQEAIATLGQPEETVFSIPPSRYGTRDPRYFPLPDGADITSHDLARFELGLDALDAAPFVGALGGLASVAIPFLGRQPLLSGSSGGIPSPSAQRGAIGSDINAKAKEQLAKLKAQQNATQATPEKPLTIESERTWQTSEYPEAREAPEWATLRSYDDDMPPAPYELTDYEEIELSDGTVIRSEWGKLDERPTVWIDGVEQDKRFTSVGAIQEAQMLIDRRANEFANKYRGEFEQGIPEDIGFSTSGSNREYYTLEDPDTDQLVEVRVLKDHRQKQGGGFDQGSGEPYGESDVDMWFDKDGVVHVEGLEDIESDRIKKMLQGWKGKRLWPTAKPAPAVQVSSEALPSTGLIEGRMIKRMPIDIQDEYERQVQEIIGPSLYDKLGLTVVDEAIAPSKYDGHQGRSLQTMLRPETEVNKAGDLVLTPDYKKKLLELTAARGFLQDQDAVTMNFAVPLKSFENIGVGYIDYDRVITDDEMRFFDEMLDELGAKDDTIARVTTPKGIKFLNLGMDDEKFQDLMQSVHTKSGQKIDLFKNDLGEEMDYGYIGGSDWRGGQEAYQKIGAEIGDAGDGKQSQPWWSADDEFISLKERIREHRRQFIKDNPLPEKTIREIADENDARYQREGLTLRLNDHSDEAMDVLASRMFDEALGVLRGGDRTGRGWYTSRYDQALGELAVKIPELDLETKTQKDLYTTLTGIFSDGTAIQPNTELAVNQYRDFLRTGKVNAMTPTAGQRNKSFRNNLDKLQDLIDDKGLEGAMEFLDGFSTTRDLQKLTNRKIGYLQDQRLPNSVIFGDKVGVFMANLKGHPDYLTMDRWWNRTVHRLRGHMGDEPSEKGLKRFRELLGREKEQELMRKAGHGPQYAPAARRKTLTKEARRLSKQYQKKDYKDGTPLEVAANTIFKAEMGLRDVAKSGGEKKFQLDLARKVAERFRQDTEYSDMTAADLQAIMWFAEKRRMKEFGSRDVRGSEELDFMDAVERLPPNVLDPSLKNTPEPSPLSP